jgi:hypothetical protein
MKHKLFLDSYAGTTGDGLSSSLPQFEGVKSRVNTRAVSQIPEDLFTGSSSVAAIPPRTGGGIYHKKI